MYHIAYTIEHIAYIRAVEGPRTCDSSEHRGDGIVLEQHIALQERYDDDNDDEDEDGDEVKCLNS